MARNHGWLGVCIAATLATGVEPARAGSAAVVATQGQTAEQMAKDQSECQTAAKQSSGYDPALAATPPTSSKPHVGGRVKGAAAGAGAGAAAAEVQGRQHEAYDRVDDDVKQKYRRDEAKETAAAGAAVGAAKQRHERRADRRTERSAEQDTAKKQAAFDQAYKSCLTGRGYTVR